MSNNWMGNWCIVRKNKEILILGCRGCRSPSIYYVALLASAPAFNRNFVREVGGDGFFSVAAVPFPPFAVWGFGFVFWFLVFGFGVWRVLGGKRLRYIAQRKSCMLSQDWFVKLAPYG